MLKKVLFIFFSFLLGGIFIFSGLSKLHPIEPFEYTFVDLGVSNWKFAPFIARFFIGLEIFLGTLFILNIKIKTASIVSICTLVLFSIYLMGLLYINGNTGDCGCFGRYLQMTPLQALIKNAIMILMAIFLFKFYKGLNFKGVNFLFYGLVPASFVMPHVLNYVDLSYSQAYLSTRDKTFKLEVDTLNKYATVNLPPKNLSEGKQVIAFMSLTCPHCRIAAKKMRIIKERNPKIPMYFVLNGDKEMIKPFFEDTRASNISFCILNGKGFIFLAGTSMPAIYLVNKGMVENSLSYFSLDQEEIEKWMKE